MPKPGDWRMTVETLASGQPRPYADSIYRYRVYLEHCSYIRKGHVDKTPPNDTWEPVEWSDEVVKEILQAVKKWKDSGDWAEPKLSSFERKAPGLFEFQVTLAYTD